MAASIWTPGSTVTPALPATAPVAFVLGTVAAPGVTFVGFASSGIWSAGSGSVDVAVSGVAAAKFDAAGFTLPTGKKLILAPEVDVASAATCDIGVATSNSIRITGTSNITSFGTTYRGPLFVRFAGVLTLSNSATLILPGGVNFTSVAGDSCIVVPKATAGVSDGWVVVSYQSGVGGSSFSSVAVSGSAGIGGAVSGTYRLNVQRSDTSAVAQFYQGGPGFSTQVYFNNFGAAGNALISRLPTGELTLQTSGADPIDFYTAGISRARINATGNVTIAAPSSGVALALTGTTTISSLTSGRVTYAGASGLLQDSANLTFSGSALAVVGSLSTTGIIDSSAHLIARGAVGGHSGSKVALDYAAGGGRVWSWGVNDATVGTFSIELRSSAGSLGLTAGVFSSTGLSLPGTFSTSGTTSLASGTVSLPGLYLSTDTTSGLYRIGSNNLGVAISGAKVMDISATGLGVTGSVTATGAFIPGALGTAGQSYVGANSSNTWVNAPTSQLVYQSVGNIAITTVSSTGLAVIGAFSTTGNLTVSGTGPHAVGGAVDVGVQWRQAGSFVASAVNAYGFRMESTIRPAAGGGSEVAGILSDSTLATGSSGVTTIGAQIYGLGRPITINGTGSYTNAATIYVSNAMSGATNNYSLWVAAGTSKFDGITVFGSTLRLKGYLVAALPAGVQGDKAFVTNALTPTYLTIVVGGGAVVTEVFYNGTNWVCT